MRSRPLEGLAIVLAIVFIAGRLGPSSPSSPSSPGGGGKKPARPGFSWSDDEMRTFIREIRPSGVPLDAMLAMMVAESGLDPEASSGSAWGLNQAQGPLLRASGWTGPPPSFGKLSVSEQLPWVAKMLRVQIRAIGYAPQNAAELWRMNLSPKAAKAKADPIYRRDVPEERPLYEGNKGLDRDGKGAITMNDLQRVMAGVTRRAQFQTHLAQLRRLEADGTATS